MSRTGKGFTRYIDPTEDASEVAIELANKLDMPVLTDIQVDWGSLSVEQVVPQVIPDLFAGDSIRIQGKFNSQNSTTMANQQAIVTVEGKVNGRRAKFPMKVALNQESKTTKTSSKPDNAIALIWAKNTIADYMREINTPDYLKQGALDNDALKNKVIDMGLNYSLSTRWTSFVAVSRKVINNNPDENLQAQVPLAKVKGVSKKAYGQSPLSQTNHSFAGGATPEPAFFWGLMLILFWGYTSIASKRQRVS